MPGEDHPYRDAPVATPAERLPIRRGSYVIAALVGAVGAGVTAVLGGPIEWIGGIGLAAGAQTLTLLALRSRRRVLASLGQLPFPVHHDPALDAVPERNPPRSIDEVRVVLATILDDRDAERAGNDIVARVPGLVAAIDGDRFTLTRWPMADDHMMKLRDVLASWGRELHERHGVREVVVRWVYRSPG